MASCFSNSYIDNTSSATCGADNSPTHLQSYLSFLVIGMLMNGYAGACIYSLGVTFLEMSTPSAQSALFLGRVDKTVM